MRYLDQCQRSLPDRFSKEVCDAILRDHVMHVGPRDTHAIACLQQWFDSRSAIGCSGRKADDGLATAGMSCPADETNLGGHSAVELAFELVDADLACQIDRKGLGDRNHARLAGDLLGMAHLIDWKDMEAGVAPIPEMTQRLIWDPAQADLQGRAIVDDRSDIACHTLCHLADLRMNILRNRRIDPY